MNYLKNEISNLLNNIPTKLRSKYIYLLKKKNIKLNIIEELNNLVKQTDQKILPKITYPDLPITDQVDDIKNLIKENQVIVIAGETGSGKSTQLPKICLDLDLGKKGLIGHTQPRRIAARSIANKIAIDLAAPTQVSFKIRFSDKTSDNTLIKVMTDGILLSEIKSDIFLSNYEVIIIDEAHERSLNIDFLLGCIKKILPFRPDLKIIITSATIDYQKFISYFRASKLIVVKGRTYPVEIRYQNDENFNELSIQERVLYAINELSREDIIVFLPTERDIHETLEYLNKQDLIFTEILPLFSRLSQKDQNKIFNSECYKRRIILATNIAETSLTIPNIKYVIDSGLARVSRYSYRTKIQRLPIEKISQASANQRSGRCGRLSAGVCIRLYSEENFQNRKKYTDPEILRTNLASVILQMLFLKLGNIQDFPFIDTPDPKFVKDGFKLLFELGAISDLNYSNPKITAYGIKMAIMPLDPKLARIVIEGFKQKTLKEVIHIVSFLSIQDPRERPLKFQQKADEKHSVDKDQYSDFITILNLNKRINNNLKDLSNTNKKKYLKKNFISPVRVNEWNDIYKKIVEIINQFGWKIKDNSNFINYEKLHTAIASGFLSNIGFNYDNLKYIGARGLKFFIFPGSSQFKKNPKWLLSSEIIETTKTYARNVAKIESEWLESLSTHLIKKDYDEPRWNKDKRSVMINEKVILYGLEIIFKRSIQYSKINLKDARHIFIEEALINGNFESKAYFYQQNIKLISQIENLENKLRRKDILVDKQVMYKHYNDFIPANICNGVTFDKWLKTISKEEEQQLIFNLNSIMKYDAKKITQEKFPDILDIGEIKLPLEYHFNPLDEIDGATVTIPIIFLNNINPNILDWGIYGFLYDKIISLLKSLPKNIRKNLIPLTTNAKVIFKSIDFDRERYKPLKSVLAQHITKIFGYKIDETIWHVEKLEKHLILNIKVIDENDKIITIDKNINALKKKYKKLTKKIINTTNNKVYCDWDFNNLEYTKQIKEYGINKKVYNCLEEYENGVNITYKFTEKEANNCMQKALKKLVNLRIHKYLVKNIKNNNLVILALSLKINNIKDKIIDMAIDLSYFPISKFPYTKSNFENFYNDGLKFFLFNKSNIESLFSEIIKYKNEIEKKLNIKNIPLHLIQIFTNIKVELDELFIDKYLYHSVTFLKRYKYYIKALDNRIQKAKINLERDKLYQLDVEKLKIALNKKIKAKDINSESNEIIKINFFIKELWISWYLQNIKTIKSISYKKILVFINAI